MALTELSKRRAIEKGLNKKINEKEKPKVVNDKIVKVDKEPIGIVQKEEKSGKASKR